jgi:hypothetical protein
VTHDLRPLTERILARLPGPRLLWVAVWALVPPLNAGANLLLDTGGTSAVWEQRRALGVGAGRLSSRCGAAAGSRGAWRPLRATTLKTLEGDAGERFREMNSVAGPLLASVATSGAFAVSALVRDGWESAILRGATWFVLGVAFWTFLWTYASLQLGLDRLGRERLLPDPGRVDPSLGLRPLGGVAFMGLWMLFAWLVPVLLTGLPDVVGVVIGVLVLGGGLAGFFLSFVRLHRVMVEVKAGEVALARDLYAQAYEPVRTVPTLEALESQRSLLAAADALEKRARAIHEWPIDEGILAGVITIATSVIAVTVARLILDPLGL